MGLLTRIKSPVLVKSYSDRYILQTRIKQLQEKEQILKQYKQMNNQTSNISCAQHSLTL